MEEGRGGAGGLAEPGVEEAGDEGEGGGGERMGRGQEGEEELRLGVGDVEGVGGLGGEGVEGGEEAGGVGLDARVAEVGPGLDDGAGAA